MQVTGKEREEANAKREGEGEKCIGSSRLDGWDGQDGRPLDTIEMKPSLQRLVLPSFLRF